MSRVPTSQENLLLLCFTGLRLIQTLDCNGQFLWIPSIGREDSGTYTCFAENTYSSGNKGKANATIEIDVQCQ